MFGRKDFCRREHGVHREIVILVLLLLIATSSSPAQESDSKTPSAEEKSPIGEEESSLSQSPNLHQWGAVTLFHGLPSEHVRAIAQDRDGALWFGTDVGLATY